MPPSEGQGEGAQATEGGEQQQPPEGRGEGTPAGGEQQPQPFADTIQDQSLKDWVSAKGWKDPESVVKSAYNLEKMVGAPADEVVRVPKDADTETVRGVLSRLGMPEQPDKYEIPAPENLPVDEGFMNWAREAFHKAGLTAEQAKTLAQEHNTYVEQFLGQSQDDYDVQVQADEQVLRREWGNGFERQMRSAKTAAEQLGFNQEVLDAMESTMGYAGTMKFMADLGQKLGEDSFVRGEETRQGFHGQMTPQEARQAWMSMTSDAEQMKALRDNQHPQHKAVLEKKAKLFQIMHPDQ